MKCGTTMLWACFSPYHGWFAIADETMNSENAANYPGKCQGIHLRTEAQKRVGHTARQ